MKDALKLDLGNVDDIFSETLYGSSRDTGEPGDRVLHVDIAALKDFINPFSGEPQPFDSDVDDQFIESIRQYGVEVPIIVRPTEGGYEILGGHRRRNGAVAAEVTEVPILVKRYSDEEAVRFVLQDNLKHRLSIKQSEWCRVIKMELDMINVNGQRPESSGRDGQSSLELIAAKYGMKPKTTQRYQQCHNLIPEIMTMLDEGKIAISPAAEIALLGHLEDQSLVFEAILGEEAVPTQEQATAIKKLCNEMRHAGNIPQYTDVAKRLQEPKPNQKETVKIPLEGSFLAKYYKPGTPPKQIMSDIELGLQLLQRERAKKRQQVR